MKQPATILFFLCTCLIVNSQKTITTDVPCTDVMAQNAKGRWIKSPNQNPTNSKEIDRLLNEFHQMLLKVYPQPTGVDAISGFSTGMSSFASKRKLDNRNNQKITFDESSFPHFSKFN